MWGLLWNKKKFLELNSSSFCFEGKWCMHLHLVDACMHELCLSNLLFRTRRPVVPISWLIRRICRGNGFSQLPVSCFICIYSQPQIFTARRHKWAHSHTVSPKVSWGEDSAVCILNPLHGFARIFHSTFYHLFVFLHKLGLRLGVLWVWVDMSLGTGLCMLVLFVCLHGLGDIKEK